jgi:hypothetical protein
MNFLRIKNERLSVLVKLLICFVAGLLTALVVIRIFRL